MIHAEHSSETLIFLAEPLTLLQHLFQVRFVLRGFSTSN